MIQHVLGIGVAFKNQLISGSTCRGSSFPKFFVFTKGVWAALECRIGIFPAKTHPTNEIWACSIPKQLHWNVFLLYFLNHWFNIWQLHFWLKIDPSCALCCSTKASKCRRAFWQVETKHSWFVHDLCIFGRISDVDTVCSFELWLRLKQICVHQPELPNTGGLVLWGQTDLAQLDTKEK